MIVAELRALQSAIAAAASLTVHLGEVARDTTPPFASMSGGWEPDRLALYSDGSTIDGSVLLTVTHTSEANVHDALARIARAIAPDFQPTRLPVAGRYVVVEWLGMESDRVLIDRDVTYGNTNRHPAFATVSLNVDSQPLD